MIKIRVSNGVPYIWDPQEWLRVRQEHRISGVLDGPMSTGLGGRLRWNLPMRLSDVEVQYLVSQGIAQTVHAPSLSSDNPNVSSHHVDTVKEERRLKQLEIYKTKRKTELEIYADKVLEGKRRKGKLEGGGTNTNIPDKESFIQNELNKITKCPYEMYELDLRDPFVTEEEYISFEFKHPKSYVEKLRLRVFEDFHFHKKYWVTPGVKFGGDFLAYPGDPNDFHAEFIIMCPEKSVKNNETLASQRRLAMTVKKTLLIATLDEETDKLKYYIPTIGDRSSSDS